MDDFEPTTIEAAIARAMELCPRYIFMLHLLFPRPRPGSGGITGDRNLRLYYDPDEISQWQLDWAATRIIVVIEHYKRRHPARQEGREQITWDMATEISITSALHKEGFSFPPSTFFPDTFKLPDSLTAEEYQLRLYQMCLKRRGDLEAQADQITDQLVNTSGMDIPEFGSASSEEPKEWEDPVNDDNPALDYLVALMAQREHEFEETEPGTAARDDVRTTDATRNSAVDWRGILYTVIGRMLSEKAGDADYSYLMPDSEVGLHQGIIMPGMVGYSANIVFLVDSSASMGNERIAQAKAEIEAVLSHFRGDNGVFIYSCDTVIHAPTMVRHTNQVKIVGGGGTDLRAGIAAVVNHYPQPDILVILTDGDTPWPDQAPQGFPVLVIMLSSKRAPKWVAKTIRIKMGA